MFTSGIYRSDNVPQSDIVALSIVINKSIKVNSNLYGRKLFVFRNFAEMKWNYTIETFISLSNRWPGITLFIDAPVEILADPAGRSWGGPDRHGVNFLQVPGKDAIDLIIKPQMVDELREPAPDWREFRIFIKPSVALGHGGQSVLLD